MQPSLTEPRQIPTADIQHIDGLLDERHSSSVKLHMKTSDGRQVTLTLGELIVLLEILEAGRVVPDLPFGWMSRTKNAYGISV